MLLRITAGLVLGLSLGAFLGSLVKSRGSYLVPYYGGALGAVFGMVIAFAMSGCSKPRQEDLTAYNAIPTVVTTEEFQREVLASPKPVLVDFTTTWCGYCRRLAPTLGSLSQEYKDRVKFVKVDGDQSRELAERYRVAGYPTIIIFRQGQEAGRLEGAHSEADYRKLLDQQ